MKTAMSHGGISPLCAREDDGLTEAFGWLATVTTWILFLVPLETISKIVKADSVADFSALPYITTFIMTVVWTVYSLPNVTPCRTPALVTNAGGIFIELSYIVAFCWYAGPTRDRTMLLATWSPIPSLIRRPDRMT